MHLIVDYITANYALSSVVLSGPGGPFILFPGCVENQVVSLSNTTLMLHSGHYTLQVLVGNEWGINYSIRALAFRRGQPSDDILEASSCLVRQEDISIVCPVYRA